MATRVKTENGVAMCLIVYLDVSGSMIGNIDAVLESFQQLLQNVMHEYDRICVKLFNDRITQAFTDNISVKFLLNKFDTFRRFVHSIIGGSTELYYAIADAMNAAYKLRRETIQYLRDNGKQRTVVTNVIVFTDGGDNSGKPPYATLVNNLVDPGKPDFHFTLISVADDAGARQIMRGFANAIRREVQKTQAARRANRQTCQIVDDADILTAFGHSQASLRAMREITTVQRRTVRVISPGQTATAAAW